MEEISWLEQAIPESSRDLFVRGKDIVVPRKEAQHLKHEHGISIETPITLEEVGNRAAEKPKSEHGEALSRWRRRLYMEPKEEFIGKIMNHRWKVKGPKTRLEGEKKAAAIGWAIERKYMDVKGETGESP